MGHYILFVGRPGIRACCPATMKGRQKKGEGKAQKRKGERGREGVTLIWGDLSDLKGDTGVQLTMEFNEDLNMHLCPLHFTHSKDEGTRHLNEVNQSLA